MECLLFNISVEDAVGDDPDDDIKLPLSLFPENENYDDISESVLLEATEEELQRVDDHFGKDVSEDLKRAALMIKKPGSWFCVFNGRSGRCDIYQSSVEDSRYVYHTKDFVPVTHQAVGTDEQPTDQYGANNSSDDDHVDDVAPDDAFCPESAEKIISEETDVEKVDESDDDCDENQGHKTEDVCGWNQGHKGEDDFKENNCDGNQGQKGESVFDKTGITKGYYDDDNVDGWLNLAEFFGNISIK